MPDKECRTPLAEDQAAEGVALLIVDMISDWRFPDGEALAQEAAAIAPAIAALKARCKDAKIPVIYVNDNQGRWRSDFRTIVEHALAAGGAGADICRTLAPDEADYFVLKPKHSGFFETPLHLLLEHLHANRLIITGVSTDQCVLMTASDAKMRDFEVHCPVDCMASHSQANHQRAMEHLQESLKIPTEPSTDQALDFTTHSRRSNASASFSS